VKELILPETKTPQEEKAVIQDRTRKWEELKKEVHNCMKCRLARTRRKVVFGEGNPHSMLMIIGEAPGADEDRQGEPFVGKAGQLLTKMLAAIDVSREEVFIGNILKCRPPSNRDPNQDEIQVCSHFLYRQIELINPQVILALGRFSSAFLLNSTSGIMKLRGKSYKLGDRIVVPTLHPSALLRKEELKRPAWEDLKLLRSILEEKGFYRNKESS
jgi:DNA polymerase